MLRPEDFFDLAPFKYSDLFQGIEFVWDALKKLPEYIQKQLTPGVYGSISPNAEIDESVYIGPNTVVESGVIIKGPTIIGAHCEIRAGAYIRGQVVTGDRVVIGHTTELKTCLLFDEVTVPHFSYVGDSILGRKAHLGAGAKISNFKLDGSPIVVRINDRRYNTGLVKFGAILGDYVEVGCNAVLNPGTLIGKRTMVYTNASLLGYYPPDSIVKLRQNLEVIAKNR